LLHLGDQMRYLLLLRSVDEEDNPP
jgi:hypothetical protein